MIANSIKSFFTFLSKNFIAIILPIITSYLGYWYSNHSFYNQKTFENRRIAYTKLVPASQSFGQAKTDYYDNQQELYFLQKGNKLKPEPGDSAEIVRRRNLDLEYMKYQIQQQKEFLEMVVLAEVSFEMDDELQAAVDALIKFRPYHLQQYPEEITLKNIDTYHDNLKNEISTHMEMYNQLRLTLIDLLLKRLENGE